MVPMPCPRACARMKRQSDGLIDERGWGIIQVRGAEQGGPEVFEYELTS